MLYIKGCKETWICFLNSLFPSLFLFFFFKIPYKVLEVSTLRKYIWENAQLCHVMTVYTAEPCPWLWLYEAEVHLISRSGRSPEVGSHNPLWYSWLEISMDRGDWQTTVHGAAKSWTWLSDWAQNIWGLVGKAWMLALRRSGTSPPPGKDFKQARVQLPPL